jgi:hypothetical protein
MKRALARVAAIGTLVVGCGGGAASEPPAQSPADTAPTADAAAADTAPAAPAAEKPAGDDGEAWAGEAEAKSEKAPADGGKAADTRTMEVIAQIVKDNRQPVRDCVDKAKKDLPDLKGDMVIHFVIDPEGKVKKAELNQERSNLKAPPVVDCAIGVIKGIKFPASSRGMDTTVNYPYNFK